jgi:hypothetical protein
MRTLSTTALTLSNDFSAEVDGVYTDTASDKLEGTEWMLDISLRILCWSGLMFLICLGHHEVK